MQLGRRLASVAFRATIVALRQVPILGIVVELGQEAYGVGEAMRQEQDQLALQQRVQQLEELAALRVSDVEALAREAVAEERASGSELAPEKEQAFVELMAAMPARAREVTRATIELARRQGTAPSTVLPVDGARVSSEQRDAFYADLLPKRRPRFREGDSVPHAHVGWQIAELLGSGGFGEVWRVRHEAMSRDFALKFCLGARDIRVLQREAETLLALRRELPGHENIVALLELNLVQEPFWLAFDYVAGGTLEDWIRSSAGPRPWSEVSPMLLGILQGMAAAHEKGIIHRDLKPANVLLTQSQIPKIADFGLGKVLAAQPRASFSMAGAGTQGYMSPEQEEGLPADATDDVFSLGVMSLEPTHRPHRQPDEPRF